MAVPASAETASAEIGCDRRRLPDRLLIDHARMAAGWALRRMAWPAEDRAAPRGRLLVLSGRVDSGEKYPEAMAHWRARGWHVTSFDWRGQGGSSAGSSAGSASGSGGGAPAAGAPPEPGFALLLDDLAAIVAGGAGCGPGPQVAVAHSLGDHRALRLMAERGWHPAAAVLAAPMIRMAGGPLPAVATAFLARAVCALGLGERRVWRTRPGREAVRRATLTGSADRFEDEGWWTDRMPAYRVPAPRWAWLDAAFRSIAALRRAPLEALGVPLLVLAAACDRLVSNAAIVAAAARLPDARLLIFDAAHELLREADPVRPAALAAIDRFLDEIAPCAGSGAWARSA